MKHVLIALLALRLCLPLVGADKAKEDSKKEALREMDVAEQKLRDAVARIPDQPINANGMAMLFLQNKVLLNIQANRALLNKNMA